MVIPAAQAHHSYAFSHPRKSSGRSSSGSSEEADDSSDEPEEATEEEPEQNSGKDKYIGALKEISGKYIVSNLKKAQRVAAKNRYNDENTPVKILERIKSIGKQGPLSSADLQTQGYLMATARYAMSSNDMGNLLMGAKIYERLGQGGRASVKRKLIRGFERGLKAAEENYEKLYKNSGKELYSWDYNKDPSLFVNHYTPLVETFLKRNPTLPPTALEKTLAPASVIGLVGGALFFSNGVTGNAISNLSNTTSSWIGGVLFCIGLVSCFFWVKNNKKK